jgi:hypothetical protein
MPQIPACLEEEVSMAPFTVREDRKFSKSVRKYALNREAALQEKP